MNFETWFQSSHPGIPIQSVIAVLKLTEEGATVPFIARYRKERTGQLSEVDIQNVVDGKERWDQITHRQAFIIKEIESQQKLTPELKEKILSTFKSELLDDIYLPYKKKRKTKAAQAKEAGLEPLADWIWNCGHGLETPHPGQTLEIWAFTFRNDSKGIKDADSAIAGAQDILTERLSEIQDLRQMVRTQVFEKWEIHTKKAEKAKSNSKFENYFEYRESIQSLRQPQNSHRYLAMRRGWTEEELVLTLEAPVSEAECENQFIQEFENAACTIQDSPGADVLRKAARLAYKVYVFSSIENEVHKALREVADEAAIQVFSENVRKLLLAAPYGSKAVLGIDPGIRTGCKLAVVTDLGNYIASTVIYLNTDQNKEKAKTLLAEVVKTGSIAAIAVGNGTGGRETETFVRTSLRDQGINIPVVMVSESGASVYSASEAAREEFPDLDVTVRGAISIARRLQDPLAELVKIDPKSIGVGQYQHDVSPHALKRSLTFVVESCVNQVGVNLNTASYHLLSYVSGIGPGVAKNIVEYRTQHGLFQTRDSLLKVPHFSKKTFEQAAGFLRIPNSLNPLDNTGVHPENYGLLEGFATSQGKTLKELTGSGVQLLKANPSFKEKVGPYTFDDIIKELEKPGRDPRDQFTAIQFREDIHEVKDLKQGMVCPGIVTNVTNFGAFVDIGVHQDGLVHISQLSDRFVKDPREVVSPGDQVQVRVLEVSIEKNQISLSMKNVSKSEKEASRKPPQIASVQRAANGQRDGLGRGRPGIRVSKQSVGASEGERRPKAAASKGVPEARIAPLPRPHDKGKQGFPKARKPKEAFNNAFAGLAALRDTLKKN